MTAGGGKWGIADKTGLRNVEQWLMETGRGKIIEVRIELIHPKLGG